MANKSIYVTMPTLAPLEEVTQLMQGIWERGIMTHNGPWYNVLRRKLLIIFTCVILFQ